ncbi:hypothetical protein [Stratiformator vulcanicus]|uniref:Trypsin n=1 Tax=Stratiformator vulcanicus TaxID=2527980 RepID=A0A517R7V7_9PLAN|nr:hypothetical protein [Stratiformator vulcanicus]QDT39911.1 hypothetical protein Pan189_43230 [Stratiformator vulcanicus]
MTLEEKLKIASQSTNVLHQHLFGFSVSIIDTADSENPEEWSIFSGTLVEIEDRLFVATASHCIENLIRPSRYWLLGDIPAFKAPEVPQVIATHGTANDRPDVGLIELDPDSFRKISPKTGVPLSRIKPVGTGRDKRTAQLIGSPSQNVEHEIRAPSRGLKAVVMGYTSLPLNQSDWPTFNAAPTLDRSIDILMEYPSGTADTTRMDTGEPVKLPDPKGMSGGGLWDQGFDTDEMWSPDSAFLIGIQSAWFPNKRHVRAVQIAHWLNLIKRRFPELQEAVESAA